MPAQIAFCRGGFLNLTATTNQIKMTLIKLITFHIKSHEDKIYIKVVELSENYSSVVEVFSFEIIYIRKYLLKFLRSILKHNFLEKTTTKNSHHGRVKRNDSHIAIISGCVVGW